MHPRANRIRVSAILLQNAGERGNDGLILIRYAGTNT